MVRQGHCIALVVAFLIAVVVVGCASAQGNIDERDGEEGGAVTNEQTTAPKGDRSAAGTAQELVGFDEDVVSSLGHDNVPAGFGEGSLWATDQTLLKRVDPQTGEVVAEIPLKHEGAVFTRVAFGAGSAWVSSGLYETGPAPKRGPGDVVIKIDPRTNRVVDRIPVDPPTGLAFGHGSVWATSASYGTVSRIDPQSGKVVAKIKVGRGVGDIATDESSGAVWVANKRLTRVDPETNRVAEMSSRADGGVAVGEGAVWVSSADKLLKVDPETNEVAGIVSVGASYSQLVVYGGGVWAMGTGAREYWLVRVDPSTMHVVAAEEIGPYWLDPRGLAAGGGYVSYSSGEGLARVSATSWQEQTTEEARCEGKRTFLMKGDFITTNDIPGCPNGGLFSGTDKADALDGLSGEDEIHGLGGVDDIEGGDGNDVIYGGPGDDTWLSGDDGDDVIYGGDGDDGNGESEMSGGPGEDVLYGGDGNDFLNGDGDGGQRDKLYCGEGRDYYEADKNDYVDSCEIKGGRLIF